MSHWLEQFLREEFCTERRNPIRLPAALCKIAALDPQGSDELLLDVVEACYQANKFEDQIKVLRKRNRDLRNELPGVQQAITLLRSLLSQNTGIGSWTLGRAYLLWKDGHKPKRVQFLAIEDTRVTLAEIQEEFLGYWANALKVAIPGVKCGPFLYRFQSGPLLYPTALDEPDTPPLDPALNGLIFNLAFLFRRTTSKETVAWMTGSPMPSSGRPHYHLVALLGRCALPDRSHLTTSIVKTRVEHLVRKQVTLAAWPS